MKEARIVAARTLSLSVRELTFEAWPDFSFEPGQWVSIRLPDGAGGTVSRSYSIASAPRALPTFDIAVTRVNGGVGSEFLHRVEPGVSVPMSPAQGFFTLESLERAVLMVATGTGVSPFRSMLQAHLAGGDPVPSFTLLFGARTEDDLLYRTEFESLSASRQRFRFVPTLSRASDGWQGLRGRVQAHIPRLVADLGGACEVYVCGLHKMVEEVRALLRTELAMPRKRVHTERFD